MSDIVISVENLTKEYRIGTISHRTLQRDIQSWWARLRGKDDPNLPVDGGRRKKLEQFADENGIIHALKDVSFEVRQGEVLGIIGKNGAGKSTLLKILSRVTAPTSGCVKIKGRIGSLLEVGTGFHPELTGRENIYMNGAILGMKKKEIDRKLDEIIDFSGVEQFIDTPVKRYSSGMYVRLAFAVAAHLDPEILVIDEVLAVGDAEFQKKCLGKMDDVSKKEGRTVLFVSHNMPVVASLCQRGLLFNNGLIHTGDIRKIVETYSLGEVSDDAPLVKTLTIEDKNEDVTEHMLFKTISVIGEDSARPFDVCHGESLKFEIDIVVARELIEHRFMIGIQRADDLLVSVIYSPDNESSMPPIIGPGEYKLVVESELRLAPGRYFVVLAAKPIPGYWQSGHGWAVVNRACMFSVRDERIEGFSLPQHGVASPRSRWEIDRVV